MLAFHLRQSMPDTTSGQLTEYELEKRSDSLKEDRKEQSTKVLPLGAKEGTKGKGVQIILSLEDNLKELIDNIANRGENYIRKNKTKGDTEVSFSYKFDEYPEDLPKSHTGVLIHYFLKGVKQDFNVAFDKDPACVRERKSSVRGSSENTLTAKDKNEILEQCNMLYYDEMGLDDEEIFAKMQEAMQKKKFWESKGWFLTPEKTKPAYKVDSDKYKQYLQDKEDTRRKRSEYASGALQETRKK